MGPVSESPKVIQAKSGSRRVVCVKPFSRITILPNQEKPTTPVKKEKKKKPSELLDQSKSFPKLVEAKMRNLKENKDSNWKAKHIILSDSDKIDEVAEEYGKESEIKNGSVKKDEKTSEGDSPEKFPEFNNEGQSEEHVQTEISTEQQTHSHKKVESLWSSNLEEENGELSDEEPSWINNKLPIPRCRLKRTMDLVDELYRLAHKKKLRNLRKRPFPDESPVALRRFTLENTNNHDHEDFTAVVSPKWKNIIDKLLTTMKVGIEGFLKEDMCDEFDALELKSTFKSFEYLQKSLNYIQRMSLPFLNEFCKQLKSLLKSLKRLVFYSKRVPMISPKGLNHLHCAVERFLLESSDLGFDLEQIRKIKELFDIVDKQDWREFVDGNVKTIELYTGVEVVDIFEIFKKMHMYLLKKKHITQDDTTLMLSCDQAMKKCQQWLNK